ncbi:MAG: hypothetical protein IT242_07730 [Bacteroidia bacterium]|nr:hypothetical protein [Bacteroidia bacterium]
MRWFIPVLFLPFLLGFSFAGSDEKIIHVVVALCDNDSQGIVPVPRKIGNGNDPDNNLYWGCGYGVRTFFKQSAEWKTLATVKNPKAHVMERIIFRHKTNGAILVADAYRGSRIKECTADLFKNASGNFSETITFIDGGTERKIELGDARLIAYVGHDGLMDFSLDDYPVKKKDLPIKKEVMIYACMSRSYYYNGVLKSGAHPLIWTTGLMCPEAYTLKATLDGWLLNETGAQIRERAAQAYNTYQKCGIKGARGLFVTGWK